MKIENILKEAKWIGKESADNSWLDKEVYNFETGNMVKVKSLPPEKRKKYAPKKNEKKDETEKKPKGPIKNETEQDRKELEKNLESGGRSLSEKHNVWWKGTYTDMDSPTVTINFEAKASNNSDEVLKNMKSDVINYAKDHGLKYDKSQAKGTGFVQFVFDRPEKDLKNRKEELKQKIKD